jgi:hypothetical protein
MSPFVTSGSLSLIFTAACIGMAACGNGTTTPTPTPPAPPAPQAPAVFEPGTYVFWMSTENFGQACEGPILETLAGLPPLPRGGFSLGQMAMRPEGGDWVATSEAPGTTMRFRLTFENWPGSIQFTGSAAGRAADPSPPLDPIAASAEISGGPGQASALLSGRVLRDGVGPSPGPYYAQATLTGRLVFTITTPVAGVLTCSSARIALIPLATYQSQASPRS